MRITWYGHAAFLVEAEGRRIILDPYTSPDAGSYGPIDDAADVVAVSHENARYHSGLSQIVPPFELVRGPEIPPEGLEAAGFRFFMIPVFESPEKRPDEQVTILHFRAEGLHVAFLGDLGHPLTDDEIEPIRGADIALVPAGGPPTIDYPHIPPLLGAIGPRVVVPMHYLTPQINLEIQPVERLLEALTDWPVERIGRPDFEIDRASIGDGRRILLPEPAR